MARRILDKVLELDSSFDSLLQKMYDSFMPPRNKSVLLLQENSKKE